MKYARLFYWVLVVVVYFVGVDYFNDRVREVCTAPGCKHGWYGKFNHAEKARAVAWFIGAPVAAGGLYWLAFIQLPTKVRSRRHRRLKIVK